MSEWYKESFGEDYLLVYKHRDLEGAEHEVHQMVSWLELPEHAHILDLCCGNGRHSLVLAEAGYEVTGSDLSEVLLDEAVEMDQEGRVKWVLADMRRLPMEDNQFDAVLNLFTSFGYFKQDEEHIRVLEEIHRVLKPGGRFIIDYLNPSYVKANLVPESRREAEGQIIEEKRAVENGYVKKQITVMNPDGSHKRHYEERVKLYTLEEFKALMEEGGLSIQQVHGGYDEEIYNPETSPRMIFVGSRSQEGEG